jgi:CRP/FNR family cyclic AMP-dependent transcriptional regulator
MLEQRHFKRGEIILRENDLGETAFIIEKGLVEVTHQVGSEQIHLATLGPGETLGEMSMVDDKPRSATAVALEPTVVSEIHQDELYESLQTDPKLAITLLKSLFERLREANARVYQIRAEQMGETLSAAPSVLAPTPAPVRDQPVLRLEALSTEAAAALPGEGPLRIDRFPFRIGRASHNPLVHNDLELRDQMPWQISRHHLAFIVADQRVGVVDRGSRLGAGLDGARFGGSGDDPGPVFLQGDRGQLVVGSPESPYEFELTLEPA